MQTLQNCSCLPKIISTVGLPKLVFPCYPPKKTRLPYDQTLNFTGWDGLEAKLFFLVLNYDVFAHVLLMAQVGPLSPQDCTAESQPEPLVTAPVPGERVRMPNFQGLECLGLVLSAPLKWWLEGFTVKVKV